MFTGIVEEVGVVRAAESGALVVGANVVTAALKLGGSVAVNGVCLTATETRPDAFAVDVVPETLRRSNLGSLRAGDRVNLERPLRADGRFDGHIVQGHVDGTAAVRAVTDDADALMMRFAAPSRLTRYIVEKGFIAVDGVSLTVVDCDEGGFSVTVIPHTRCHTILGGRVVGDAVNIEIDVMAKYVERMVGGSGVEVDA